jgi:quercetin dioxygenase-like cupin family protein
MSTSERPRIFHSSQGEALHVRDAPYGRVGLLHSDQNLEVVWVSKQAEAVDPGWFSSGAVDILVVVQGNLRVEFGSPDEEAAIMQPGDVLVLPPNCECRAYRWPRNEPEATIFIAAYPTTRNTLEGSSIKAD